ncbi:tachylectin-related carbohydrate-binding protein [Nonomuraea sp. NPDC049152]|uniref:tachylectin-related carbohydrate-binding protein n=1 Tax=Nonomuraea sp. NPDC049152 TaxID=3154350 RepID=UPI0033E6EEAC
MTPQQALATAAPVTLAPATGERGRAPGERTIISRGWGDYVAIASPGSGIIYALDSSGDLHWFRHLSPTAGKPAWARGSGKVALPRRAVHMAAEDSPGVTVIDGGVARPRSFAALQVGDLLFWDGSADDGPAIDHVGIYLGIDSTGRHRFISSRRSVDGPTLGDQGGPSTLDSGTLYDKSWRKAKRI